MSKNALDAAINYMLKVLEFKSKSSWFLRLISTEEIKI